MQTAVQAQVRPRKRAPRTTAADRRFRRYKPESAKAVRRPQIKETAALRRLKAAWIKYRDADHREGYEFAAGLVGGMRYTAKDVERFSIVLVELEGGKNFAYKAGHFLTALINLGRASKYTIHTEYLEEKPHCIGSRTTKDIIVHGDVGDAVGECMIGGTIIVNGNANDYAGFGMKSGRLEIRGYAGFKIADMMKGGEIHLEGENYGHVVYGIPGGKVFHKGRQVEPFDPQGYHRGF